MDSIISQFINEWGAIGLLLFCLGYMCYDNWKSNKAGRSDKATILNAVNSMGDKIDNLHDKINIVDTKVEEFKQQVDTKFELVDQKIDNMPMANLQHLEHRDNQKQETHLKQLRDLMKLGPKLHRIIQDANNKIGADHIFVGSFHNGNSNVSGIPYYKFDIIAERFSPVKVPYDCEFAHMYKDSDILRYDTLPILLVQQGMIHFTVPAEGELELASYDDIIWRRMRGRKIRQIAIRLTRDSKGSPSGFVGVVKYNMDKLDLNYLEACGKDLEDIYKDAELKEQNKE